MEVDTAKDREFYSHLVNTLGQEKADTIAPGIFAQDFNWMSWEAIKSPNPKAFFYKIIEVDGTLRLVHQRDLQTEEDILTRINKDTRFGLEYRQMSKVRERLILAENGTVTVWISPQKILPEDPPYPLDQINIAKKIDEETVWVKQLQGDFTPDGSSLSDLMLNIGEDDLWGNWNMDEDAIDDTKGQIYLEVIKQGYSFDELRKKRAELLQNTIDYQTFQKLYPGGGSVMTSCGSLDFNGSLPPWCEKCENGGGLRCKFCRKNLGVSEIVSHICVCKE